MNFSPATVPSTSSQTPMLLRVGLSAFGFTLATAIVAMRDVVASDFFAIFLGIYFVLQLWAGFKNGDQRIAALATVGALCGGIISPAVVVASGLLLLRLSAPEKPLPFPRLLLLLWAWFLVELFGEALRIFTTSGSESFSLSEWIQQDPRLLRQAALVASIVLLNEIARRPTLVRACSRWLRLGIAASFLVAAGQLLFVYAVPHTPAWFGWHLTPFFAHQLRVSGTFVDPNSAGIAFAVAGLFFAFHSAWIWSTVTLLGVCASGSRSGLIIVVCSLIFSWLFQGSARTIRGRLALVAVGLCVIIVAANLASRETIALLPSALSRAAESVRVESFQDATFSRVALWHAALAQWTHAPIIGVGLDRYRELLPPFAQALGLDIGAWNDNPGSWYLFLIVELGLVGVLLFFLDILRLRLAEPSVSAFHYAVLCSLGMALFFGCHIHDPLSALLYGAVCSQLLTSSSERAGQRMMFVHVSPAAIVLLFAPAITIVALRFPRGVFPWEIHENVLVRWTGRSTTITVSCDATSPRISVAPPTFELQTISIASPRSAAVMPLSELRDDAVAKYVCSDQPGRVPVVLEIAPAQVPKDRGLGSDQRVLGVKLAYPQPIPLDDL